MAGHLAARARFDVRPWHRVSRELDAREYVGAAMLQCLQGDAAVANDGNMLPFFVRVLRRCWLARLHLESVRIGTKRTWSWLLHRIVALTRMLATKTSSLFGGACGVPHADSNVFAFGATHVWFAMHVFSTSTPLW